MSADRVEPLLSSRLEEIVAREAAATKGPWGWFDGGDYADVVADYQSTGSGSYSCRQQVVRVEADWYFDDPQHADCEAESASEQAMADADFIAHSRQDVPDLISEVGFLAAALADERGVVAEQRETIAALRAALELSAGKVRDAQRQAAAVREQCGPAQAAVCARWVDEHGDPADWPERVRAAYANTIASMRAGSQL